MVPSAVRIQIMVNRSEDGLMAYEYIISDMDSTLILKLAACIEENTFAQMDVSPKIRIERRKQIHGRIHCFACNLRQVTDQCFMIPVSGIHFRRQAMRLGTCFQNQPVHFRCQNRVPVCIDVSDYILDCHENSLLSDQTSLNILAS